MRWIEWRRDAQVKRIRKAAYAWLSRSESEHWMRIESIYICVWLNKYFLAFLYLYFIISQGVLYFLSADTQIYRIFKIYSEVVFLC